MTVGHGLESGELRRTGDALRHTYSGAIDVNLSTTLSIDDFTEISSNVEVGSSGGSNVFGNQLLIRAKDGVDGSNGEGT